MKDEPLFADIAHGALTLKMVAGPHTVSYEVRHTPGCVFDLDDGHLSSILDARPVILVVDETVWFAYGQKIRCYAERRLESRGIMVVPGIEATKTLAFADTLCQAALDARMPRDGAFVAVGGGTIMDVVGFAASIFRRGIGYVRVPTTLIGMIDVGVGIKQAVNVDRHKNVIGSFYAPLGTINDQAFLATLPQRHLACGISEAIKIALVSDKRLFDLLEDHAANLIENGFQRPALVTREILFRSEAAMIEQLSSNLYEVQRRRLVDFGHTFSPLIEGASDYEVPHGEAVAMDMLLSSAIGVRVGLVPPWLPLRLARLLRSVGLPLEHPAMTIEAMVSALEGARLNRNGKVNLVVPTAIGEGAFLEDVGAADVVSALAAVRQFRTAA